ncbi:hypothetical protein [Flavobacterium pedocola]
MKSIKKVILGLILFFSFQSIGQVSVNVNIGTPPPWGPVGYVEARYYYIPDIQVYYDVSTSMFIYMGPRGWIHVHTLPSRYAYYDLYGGYKVVLDYRGDRPYRYYSVHKVKYPKGYKKYHQKPYKMKGDQGYHSGHHKNNPGPGIRIGDGGHQDHGGGKHGKGHGDGHGKGKNK